jgi:HPt (histidine-containing phosphotransfer) domain-containing protein
MNSGSNLESHVSSLDLSSNQVCDDFQDCPEVLASVGALFRECYPLDVNELRAAHAAKDGTRVAFLAHKIKGSALVFHNDDVVRIASELEHCAIHEQLQGTEGMVEMLGKAYDLICSTLERAERVLETVSPKSGFAPGD